jgi:hypothetical protein
MTLQKKSLIVIEAIMNNAGERLNKRETEDVYKFSHIGVGRCKSKHLDWQNDLEKVYQIFKEKKLI